jgi:hypothetical protein
MTLHLLVVVKAMLQAAVKVVLETKPGSMKLVIPP